MNVQVVVPEAFILGSGELHVDMGSAINLVCIIEKVCIKLKISMMSIVGVLLSLYAACVLDENIQDDVIVISCSKFWN